jgi:hypothetical protein
LAFTLGSLQRRPGSQFLRHRIVHIFLADRLFRQQRFHASKILLGLHQPRLRLRHPGMGAAHGRFEWNRIDLIEPVALLDVTPLRKKTLFEDARHL